MTKNKKALVIGLIGILASSLFKQVWAQPESCETEDSQTTGLYCNHGAYEGYTLFSVLRGTGVYLIDNDGNLPLGMAGARQAQRCQNSLD